MLDSMISYADVTEAWIYSKAEKKRQQKASAMRYEWLLPWEVEGG